MSDCGEGIAEAPNPPPAAPDIEQSAATWIAAFAATQCPGGEANTFYELEDYKDDKVAKGKAMHAQMMKAFARFNAANNVLYGQVVTTQDGLAERRPQRLAGAPALQSEYLLAFPNDRAKRVVRLMDTLSTKTSDRDGYMTAVSDYEKAYSDADAYTTQLADTSQFAWDSMLMLSAFELLKSAKAVMRKERDGFRFSSGERMFIEDGSGEMFEGHPNHLVEKYNRFIYALNRSLR